MITLVGSYDTPGAARDLEIVGNLAYIADATSGLQIVDISEPSVPIFVSSHDTPDYTNDVEIVGNFAYITDLLSGLEILDISEPSSPILVGSYDTPEYASDVEIVDNFAYIAGGPSGLQIVDISEPSSPILVGSYDTLGYADEVEIVGNLAYIAGGEPGLQILDISEPSSPILVSSYDTPEYANDVEIVGNLAYIADRSSGLQIVDISEPSVPILVGSYNTPGYAYDVEIVGNLAYIADGYSGLQIVNISEPSVPILVGSYDTSGNADEVEIVGNLAYIGAVESGLQIIDIEIENNPGILSFSQPTFSVKEDGTAVTAVTVSRSGGSAGEVGATINLTDGTATAPADYDDTAITVNFADGEISKTITIPIVDDSLTESDETVNLSLSNSTGGATLGSRSSAVLSILDNDNEDSTNLIINGSFENGSFTGPSWTRLEPGSSILTGWNIGGLGVDWHNSVEMNFPSDGEYVVDLNGNASGSLSQTFTTTPGQFYTLTFDLCGPDPSDSEPIFPNPREVLVDIAGVEQIFSTPSSYQLNLFWQTHQLSFEAVENQTTVKFSNVNDSGFWGAVLDNVKVSNPDAITLSPNQTVVEGATNPQNVTYTVTLPSANDQTVIVNYTTANGTAVAGTDYSNTTGTLTFNPGETSKTITIPILNDSLNEPDETFSLTLSNPVNAFLGRTTAITTITDTLTTDVTTTLPTGIENLTLTGTAHINGTGNLGSNILTGNTGNNRLDGGAGADTLYGSTGNDTYLVDNVNDTINENSTVATEIDTVQSTVTYSLGANLENLILTGSSHLNGTGNGRNNLLTGNAGNNTLIGYNGNDTLIGAGGNDTLIGYNGNDTLDGGAGDDALWGFAGDDTLNGGTGNDFYGVDSVNDLVQETSTVATEIDTVQSSITYTLGANLETLILTGSAHLNGTGNALNNRLVGNKGNNSLKGNNGNDTLNGIAGDDNLIGDSGDDTLYGGDGNDTLYGNIGEDSLHGGNNNDRLDGGDGNDTLHGVAGDDTLIGGLGNDRLNGNLGDDSLDGSAGNDTIHGGDSNDTLYGNIGNDSLHGWNNNDSLDGGDGNDTLSGDNSNDALWGGAGNDALWGGAGDDTLKGGTGNDLYGVDSVNDLVQETSTLATEIDTVYSSVTYTLGANLETLILTGIAHLNGTGNALNNRLVGNTGNNSLKGNNGNDTLNGLTGDDNLIGDSGNDTLYGGDGNDTLTGGAGKDILTGGIGSDKFDYKILTDSLLANFDVIPGFDANADKFLVATARAGFTDAGAVASLDAAGISALLNTSDFGANYGAKFTFGSRTFVAINDGIAGFNATKDAIMGVTGYTGTLDGGDFTTIG